jgi:hypothetical protein
MKIQRKFSKGNSLEKKDALGRMNSLKNQNKEGIFKFISISSQILKRT